MIPVGTVVDWWAGQSDPQRIALYTHSSYYGVLALTPLSALLVVGSSPGRPPVAAVLFLLGSVAVAVTTLLLAWAGLTRSQDERLPMRLFVGAAVAAPATLGAGRAAGPGGGGAGAGGRGASG